MTAAPKLDSAARAAAANLRRWRAEPVAFVREVFGAQPDAWQAQMLAAFPSHQRIVASACKGPGKTAVLAWLGWNFLLTRPHPKVVCTSITGDNLADGLWAEFAKWQKSAPILQKAFTWTKTRIFANDEPETWWASARSWARDADSQAQANTLAGVHADYVCFLLDEVSGIPDGVVAAAEAALVGGVESKLVMMGNPTRTDGPLYRAVTTDRHLWHVTRITGDPDDPSRSPRIDIEEARKQIARYGRDSYVVRVNILGEFPERQADKLLDVSDVEAAMKRALDPAGWMHEPKYIGGDVSRFGEDASVLCPRQGRMCFPMKEFRGVSTVEFGDRALAAAEKWGAHAITVDGGGVGGGTVDHCRNRGFGYLVHDINFGSRAQESDRFENRRSEMYWRAAEWVKAGGCLPRDAALAQELIAPIYWYDRLQRLCLESKEEIKKRLGRSPDRADAFALTFAVTVAPPARDSLKVDELGPDGRRSTPRPGTTPDWDPFAAEGRA